MGFLYQELQGHASGAPNDQPRQSSKHGRGIYVIDR
jgi:hypothetical protein